MPFEWFFGAKEDSWSLFREFRQDVEELERIEQIIGDILENHGLDTQAVRKEVIDLFEGLEKKFVIFSNRVKANRKTLQDMIRTSLLQADYLLVVEKINVEIMTLLSSVDKHLYKEDFMAFMQEAWDAKLHLHEYLETLEKQMILFQEQSKDSLEWHYKPGVRHIDMKGFLKCVQMLGGKIDTSHGKGAHFAVRFRLFSGFMGEKTTSKGKIDQVRIRDFVENARDRIEKHFHPKYLLCFFVHDNKRYRKIFVAKYGHLFRI